MVLLPFFALAGLVVLCRAPGRPAGEAVLRGCVAWGVLLTAITEATSALGLVTTSGLAVSWSVSGLVVGVAAIRGIRARPLVLPSTRATSRTGALLAGGIAAVLAGTAVTALASAPNNYDSMTYHLARVIHWVQNASVEHYPTSIPRQLHHTPWAEFGLLHLHLLSGGDRFANVLQWAAMAGSLVGVAALARLLGGDRRQALLAVALAVSLPMGILQASSTQNDYVGTFWLVASLYFALVLGWSRTEGRGDDLLGAYAGAALGLAILTKATSYLIVLPFLLWCIWTYARGRGVRVLRPLGIAMLAVLLINAGHFGRNLGLYDWPLGPRDDQARYTNETHSPPAMASNLIRNVALHTGTPAGRVNLAQIAAVERAHDLLGIESDDPRTTWAGTAFFVLERSRHEDLAGNTIHLVLLWGVLAAMIAIPAVRSPPLGAYAVSLVAAFLIFCAFLKWQPWHSRLHLPFFVLAAPLIAVVLSRVLSARVSALVVGGVLLTSASQVLANETRPLAGDASVLRRSRVDEYFHNRPELREPYTAAARLIAASGCRRVGLAIGENGWEYPLWATLTELGASDVRIDHVAVTNPSRALAEARSGGEACALLRVHPLDAGQRFTAGRGYSAAVSDSLVTLYLRETAAPAVKAPV